MLLGLLLLLNLKSVQMSAGSSPNYGIFFFNLVNCQTEFELEDGLVYMWKLFFCSDMRWKLLRNKEHARVYNYER